jgi:hypothetical protein
MLKILENGVMYRERGQAEIYCTQELLNSYCRLDSNKIYCCYMFNFSYIDSVCSCCLKVDGNEKLGGPKRRQQLNFSPALWRSRVILNLNV